MQQDTRPPSTAEKRIRCLIRGDVHGVGFRWSVRERALDLGLTGYVQNRADRTVEVIAEGPENAVVALQAFCYRGPRGARIDAVEVTEEPATGGFSSFEIRSER